EEPAPKTSKTTSSSNPSDADHVKEATAGISDDALIRDGSPEQDHLERLSKKLGTKWETVARRLKFEAEEITAFDEENRRLPDKAFKMLCAWKSRDGREATYEVLYKALSDKLVQRKDLAETFCLRSSE
ncbi:unnamed protein product, partial [Porites evermanni]